MGSRHSIVRGHCKSCRTKSINSYSYLLPLRRRFRDPTGLSLAAAAAAAAVGACSPIAALPKTPSWKVGVSLMPPSSTLLVLSGVWWDSAPLSLGRPWEGVVGVDDSKAFGPRYPGGANLGIPFLGDGVVGSVSGTALLARLLNPPVTRIAGWNWPASPSRAYLPTHAPTAWTKLPRRGIAYAFHRGLWSKKQRTTNCRGRLLLSTLYVEQVTSNDRKPLLCSLPEPTCPIKVIIGGVYLGWLCMLSSPAVLGRLSAKITIS